MEEFNNSLKNIHNIDKIKWIKKIKL
jgi:hypothetical protein